MEDNGEERMDVKETRGDLKIEEEREPSNDGHKDYWKGSKEQYLKG